MDNEITDTDRLNWIENNEFGAALVSDDDGHWAIASTGFQNVPMETPADIEANFFIAKDEWKNSVREAVDTQILESGLTHRDLKCQKCWAEYPVWAAPNPLWNSVVNDTEHFLCLTCFAVLAEMRGVEVKRWRLAAD